MRWCQVNNILCRKERTAKGEEEELPSNCHAAYMYDGALSLWWCLRYYSIWNQHRALVPWITTVCSPTFLMAHCIPRSLSLSSLLFSLSLSLSPRLDVYTTSWRFGAWWAFKGHELLGGPICLPCCLDALATQENARHTHTCTKLTSQISGIPNSHKCFFVGCFSLW